MLTRSCPAHTSIFADISPQLVAFHLENELCVIYWSRSGFGIYLLKRQRRRSAELLPLRWWTPICIYLFMHLFISNATEKRICAFLSSGFTTQMAPFPPVTNELGRVSLCRLSQGEDAVPPCDGRSALQGKLPEPLAVWQRQRRSGQHLCGGARWWGFPLFYHR